MLTVTVFLRDRRKILLGLPNGLFTKSRPFVSHQNAVNAELRVEGALARRKAEMRA